MRKYLAILRIRFINALQYRISAFATTATRFAWGFLEVTIFLAFYRVSPADFPMEISHTVAYLWMQQAFLPLFRVQFYESEIYSAIIDGSIAYEMVRPMDLYTRWCCQAAANRLAQTLIRCVLILFFSFWLPEPYRMTPPPDLPQFGLFILSSALSMMVAVTFCMLVYISMFYTLSPGGVRQLATFVSDLLTGATIPLPFFPGPLRKLLELLPFGSMQNMPLRIYSGNIHGADAVTGIALQFFWVMILLYAGHAAMNRALRRVVTQGG